MDQRELGGRGVQQLLVSDLAQAAAHLDIQLTQPFAPAACELESDDCTAAAAPQQQGADSSSGGQGELQAQQQGSGAADDEDLVLARWRVCGRPAAGEDSGLVAWALQLQLEAAAEAYYAAALGPDFDTCPPRLSGLVAALEVVLAPGTAAVCVTVAHVQPLTAPCSSIRASDSDSDSVGGDSSTSTVDSA
ncbi:hypothetical protein HXX76_013013 [Chlamydomonas incerta]|uniref:Uncharacterized protein n=1 Tax=Chlamydomonas incerta TaxID=51695 RepID=A0A835ST38_CHLIN|nr:hypothetical protein HXX76_013013 [Chlamydomonas incerta]|eukprot:KAG2426255.1 hypothetical protein HXX76_013013 [Chlamydomonas incerta]